MRALGLSWLMGWYLLAIYLAVVTFAVQQFHERMTMLAASGPKTFATLRLLDTQEKAAENEIEAADRELQSKQPEIRRARQEIDEYEKQATDLAGQAAVIGAKGGDLNRITDLSGKAAALSEQSKRVKDRLKEIFERKRSAVERHKEVQSSFSPGDRAALERLRRLDKEQAQLSMYANPFLLMPQELLTLILTLSMGVFGSTIAVSRSLYDSGTDITPTAQYYLFRPIQGAVMALTIYFLFKAGVLILAVPSATSLASHDLNPFVIAFLGIISGLFAEYAYERVELAARGIFQTNRQIGARAWAKSVAQEMTAQGKSINDLAVYLACPRDVIEAWINGEAAVPVAVQRAMVFWLGKSPSELFDYQPPRHDASGSADVTIPTAR